MSLNSQQQIIDFIFNAHKKLFINLNKRSNSVIKFQEHLDKNTCPADLNFNFTKFQLPQTIETAAIAAFHEEEISVIQTFKKRMIEIRLEILKADLVQLKEKFDHFYASPNIIPLLKTVLTEEQLNLIPKTTQTAIILESQLRFTLYFKEFNKQQEQQQRQQQRQQPANEMQIQSSTLALDPDFQHLLQRLQNLEINSRRSPSRER
jgi:hypothetical protein